MDRALGPLQRLYEAGVALQQDDSPPVWTGTVWKVNLALRPRQFYVQGTLLAMALLLFVIAVLGRLSNRWRVQSWSRVYTRALEDEFVQVGADDAATRGSVPRLVWNGGDEACLFASGRRGVQTLHATVHLRPRNDPILRAVSTLYDILSVPVVPWNAPDHVTLTFTFPTTPRINSATFAIIDKTELHRERHGRFDMKFARVLDGASASESRGLDERFAIASESGDATDRWLGEIGPRGDKQRSRLGVADRLNSPAGQFLVSLLYTDQPRLEPQTGALPESQRVERLEMTMRLPRTENEARTSLPLLALALDIVDALALTAAGRSDILALRPETHTALKKVRTQVNEGLNELSTRDAKAEAAEAEEEERRRAQQEKFDKLSPAEQAKRKQIAQKRSARKAQGMQIKRR